MSAGLFLTMIKNSEFRKVRVHISYRFSLVHSHPGINNSKTPGLYDFQIWWNVAPVFSTPITVPFVRQYRNNSCITFFHTWRSPVFHNITLESEFSIKRSDRHFRNCCQPFVENMPNQIFYDTQQWLSTSQHINKTLSFYDNTNPKQNHRMPIEPTKV